MSMLLRIPQPHNYEDCARVWVCQALITSVLERAIAIRSSGRPPEISLEHAGCILCAVLSGEWPVEDVARMFQVSRTTVWTIQKPRPDSRFWGLEFDRENPMAGLSRRRRS